MKVYLPENASEITLGQYQDYLNLIEGDNPFIYKKRVVAVFCKLTYATVTRFEKQEVNDCYDQIMVALKNLETKETKLSIDGINFYHHETLDQLTGGELIDLSIYQSDHKQYHRLMAILYRPLKKKNKIVKYNGTTEHAERMKKMPLIFFYERYHALIDFFEKMTENYPLIWGGTSEGDASLDYFKRWGWYATLVELTNTNEEGTGDILKLKKIMNLNIHEIHVFLSHRIDKQKTVASLRKTQPQS